MLDSLRKYATSWVAQLLLGLLVVSFGVWGVADVFTGYRSSDIATVGSASVTIQDYQREYESAIQRITQQTGQTLTPQQAQQAGIPQEIISQLVSQAALDDAAHKMKLGVSNEELGKAIAENPQFQNAQGSFDAKYLQLVIRSLGYDEDTFINAQRRAVLRAQLAQAFGVGIAAPDTYLHAVSDYRGETRDISYLVVTAPDAGTIAAPSDTDISTYYAAHKGDYRTAELRSFNYIELSPAQLASPSDVTDEEAKQRFDANPARFVKPEKRHIEQIVFPDRASADAAAAAIAGGKSFDDIVKERNLKAADVDLGVVTPDQVADKAVATAAFAQAANTTSGVIDGGFGPTIVRISDVQPGEKTTFDQAKDTLKKEIAEDKAAKDVSALHDSIEDARAGGATLAEAAAKFGLKLVKVEQLDNAGKDIDGKAGPDLPKGLLDAVFSTDMGLESDPLRTGAADWVWYDVSAITAPRDRPLDEVRAQVVDAWKDEERAKRLAETVDKAKTRLDNKEPIDAVAGDLGVPVQKLAGMTRVGTPVGNFTSATVLAAFDAPKGLVATADGDKPMTKILIVVDNVHEPDFNAADDFLAQTRKQLDSQFVTDLLGLYSAELRGKTNVRFNQVALQSALGASSGE